MIYSILFPSNAPVQSATNARTGAPPEPVRVDPTPAAPPGPARHSAACPLTIAAASSA
jgi:hypothetical protein